MSMSGWSARGAAANCNAEPARMAAPIQRAVAIVTRMHRVGDCRAETGKAIPATASAAPKAQTMAAPVGKSKANEAARPAALVERADNPADRELP